MVVLAGLVRHLSMLMCVVAIPVGLAGCNSFALDDGIPNTSPPAIVVGPQNAPRPTALALNSTGTYPTFGKPLTAANTQIEDTQYTSAEAQLSSLSKAKARGAISEAEYQRRVNALRKLSEDQASGLAAPATN